MKRKDNLYEQLISESNLRLAIIEVNSSHRWVGNHRPNKTTVWVETTADERVKELKNMISEGFTPNKPRHKKIYDHAAGKWRDIFEPKLYPDQYIHHAVIQVLTPIMMNRMDKWCCGSIRNRGIHYGEKAIKKWMQNDVKGTKYCAELDIHHFYESIKPKYVMARMRKLIKDKRVLDLVERLIADGILIGYYFSQWFANTLLQPLDRMIRESGYCKHYIRYMDNFTLFGPNKRYLHRLVNMISEWLATIELELKNNWQVFKVLKRKPNALGFVYGRGYTFIRKSTLLRFKRKLNSIYKTVDKGNKVSYKSALGMVVRLGQLKHANTKQMRLRIVRQNFIRMLKNIIRKYSKLEVIQWNTVLERYRALKYFALKAA